MSSAGGERANCTVEVVEENQYKVGNDYLINAESCSCNYMKCMGLPCRHVIKLRSFLKLPLSDHSLINRRWTKEYYGLLTKTRFGVFDSDNAAYADVAHIENQNYTHNKLTQAQKFRKLMSTCQVIASVASEGGMESFEKRLSQLHLLLEHWKLGKEVIVLSKDCDDIEDHKVIYIYMFNLITFPVMQMLKKG